MEMNINMDRLSVEGSEIERTALLEKLRGEFDDDIASALLEEIEKRAKEKGVSFKR